MIGESRKRKWFDNIYHTTPPKSRMPSTPFEQDFVANIREALCKEKRNEIVFLRCLHIISSNRNGYADHFILEIFLKLGIDSHFATSLISCIKNDNKEDVFYQLTLQQLLTQLEMNDVYFPRNSSLFINNHHDYQNIKFEHLNLTRMDLSNLNLNHVSFVRSILEYVDFSNSNLTHTNLQGASLNGAILENVSLNTNQNLTSQIFLNEGFIPYSSSYLYTIFSIDDEYFTLKVKFLESYLMKFKTSNKRYKEKILEEYQELLCDELCQNMDYFNNHTIVQFAQDVLFRDFMLSANKHHTSFSDNSSMVLFKIFEYHKHSKRFYLEYSLLISQLIYHLKTSGSPNKQRKAEFLETTYLNALPKEVLNKCCQSLYGSQDCTKEDQQQVLTESMCLISPDTKHVFFIHYHYYEKFLMSKPHEHMEWSYYCYLKKMSPMGLTTFASYKDLTGRLNLLDIFEFIPIFKENYIATVYSNQITHLIAAIDLGCFTILFDEALLHTYSNYKSFSEDDEQSALAECFAPLVTGDIRSLCQSALKIKITPDFAQCIVTIFQINSLPSRSKFLVFCCLSAIFTRLSSREFFGTEHSSPLALRNFAIALLNHARTYDGSHMKKDLKEWKEELAGIGSKMCCTSLLFDAMRIKLSEESHSLFHMMIPVPWL
jgi:hypothetical protein